MPSSGIDYTETETILFSHSIIGKASIIKTFEIGAIEVHEYRTDDIICLIAKPRTYLRNDLSIAVSCVNNLKETK